MGMIDGMMEVVSKDGDMGVLMNVEAVMKGVVAVVIFNYESVGNVPGECFVPGDEAVNAFIFIPIDTSNVYLDFMGVIQLHKVKYLCMIAEFFNTACKYVGVL
jgi:hypothetical protein